MLLYSPSWLYFVPGLILLVLGVLGAIALAAGPVTIFGRPGRSTRCSSASPRSCSARRSSSSASSPARSPRPISARRTAHRVGARTDHARARPRARRGRAARRPRDARRRDLRRLGARRVRRARRTSTRPRSASHWSRSATQVVLGSFFVSLLTMRTASHRARRSSSGCPPFDPSNSPGSERRTYGASRELRTGQAREGRSSRVPSQGASVPARPGCRLGCATNTTSVTFSQRISQRGPWSSTWHVVTGWAPCLRGQGRAFRPRVRPLRPSQSPRPTAEHCLA